MPNTIILRGDNVTFREEESLGSGTAIIPGMLVEFHTDDTLKPHATSAGTAAALFALQRDFAGQDVGDAYALGDRVSYGDCGKGTIIWAHLASGQNVAKGDFLMSAGTGFLTARTSTNYAVAQADEDANATSGVAAGGSLRFRARVL